VGQLTEVEITHAFRHSLAGVPVASELRSAPVAGGESLESASRAPVRRALRALPLVS
jgi:hypothetical protein